jgi:hypothetical protein
MMRETQPILATNLVIEVVLTEAKLLGEVDGFELCRRVHQQRSDVQLVVTAAGDGPANVRYGARVLRKPYGSGDLRNLVALRPVLAQA